MRNFSILLFGMLLCWGCNVSRPVSEPSFMSQVLERENLTDSSLLILYIGDGMCAECINKELINLNENSNISRNTVIVGCFSNKRHFLASVNSVSVKRKIFMPREELSLVKFDGIKQPHYLFYNANDRSFDRAYYPTDCGVERTLNYYKETAWSLPKLR